jgi:hypothetical protein
VVALHIPWFSAAPDARDASGDSGSNQIAVAIIGHVHLTAQNCLRFFEDILRRIEARNVNAG